MDEATLPTYSVAEVQAGFKAHPDMLLSIEHEDIRCSIKKHKNSFDKSRI